MILSLGSEAHSISRGTAMKTRYLIAGITIAVCAYLLISHRCGGADVVPPKDAYFTGRYIAINYHDNGNSTVLENTELKIIGGRTFIVGKIAPVNNDWKVVAGNPMWVPVDAILQISEFKNLEDVNTTIEMGQKSQQAGHAEKNPQN